MMRHALVLGVLLCAVLGGRAALTPAEQAFATARQLYVTGNVKQAAVEFAQFLKAFPTDARVADAAFLLGRSCQQLEQISDAAAAYEQVVKQAPTAEQTAQQAEAYLHLGECRFQLNDFPKAERAFAACVKLGAGIDLSAQAQYWLGESLLRQDKAGDALNAYRRVLEIAPMHPLAAWSRYAMALVETDALHYAAAIDLLEKIDTRAKDAPGEADVKLGLGLAYAGRGYDAADAAAKAADYTRAIECLKSVMNNADADTDLRQRALNTLLQLADAYYEDKQYRDAANLAQTVLNAKPSGEPALLARRRQTQALLAAKDFPAAQTAAKALVALPLPDGDKERQAELAARLLLLAQACVGAKQYPDAGAAYARIIAECPTTEALPYALMGRAWVAETQKDRAQANEAYRQMLAKCPRHALAAEAAYRLGMNLVEAKEHAAAIEALKQVPATYPQADRAVNAIAWAYVDLGKTDEANAQFERLATDFPKSPLVGNGLIQIAESLLAAKRYPEAAKAYNRAQEFLGPEHKLIPQLAYRQGSSAYNAGDYATAAEAFARVTTRYPASAPAAESLFWLAQAQEKTDTAKARESYRRYTAQYPAGALVADAALGAGRAALLANQPTAARDDLHAALELCAKLLAGQDAALSARARNAQPEAQYWLGQSFAAEKNYAEAIKAFAGVAAFPLEPWSSRALLESARCSAQSNDPQAATLTLRLLRDQFPTSDAAKAGVKLAEEYKL